MTPPDESPLPPLRMETADRPASRARGPGPSVTLLALAAFVGAVSAGILFWLLSTSTPAARLQTPPRPADQPTTLNAPRDLPLATPRDPAADAPSLTAIAPDDIAQPDRAALWQSPTGGPACALVHLPAGPQLVVIMRLAELLAHAEGAAMLDGVGTWGAWLRSELPARLGTEADNLKVLHIAFYAAADGTVRHAAVAQCRQPVTLDELASRWADAQPIAVANTKVLRHGSEAVWPIADRLVLLPWEETESVVAAGEAPVDLRSDLEALLPATDQERLLTVLAATSFLQDARHELFTAGEADLMDAALELLGPDVRSLLFSVHADQDLFVELATLVSAQRERTSAREDLAAQWRELPERVRHWLNEHTAPPGAMPLWQRLPSMAEALVDQSRFAIVGHQQWVRAYLPVKAGQNFAWTWRLVALSSTAPPTPSTSPLDVPPQPATVAERLAQRTSLSFPRNTLERALAQLAQQIGVEMEIRGQDLQVEGITKNQSFALDLRDRPASEILEAILQLASPEGKLVYRLLGPPGEQRVIVTTRQAAAALEED